MGNFEATGPTMVPVRHGDVIEVLETHHTGRTVEPPGESHGFHEKFPWEKWLENMGGCFSYWCVLNLGNGWRNGWVAGGCWDDYYYYGSFPKNSLLLAPVRFLVPKWRLGGFHLFFVMGQKKKHWPGHIEKLLYSMTAAYGRNHYGNPVLKQPAGNDVIKSL